jgi:hypothetical protein
VPLGDAQDRGNRETAESQGTDDAVNCGEPDEPGARARYRRAAASVVTCRMATLRRSGCCSHLFVVPGVAEGFTCRPVSQPVRSRMVVCAGRSIVHQD